MKPIILNELGETLLDYFYPENRTPEDRKFAGSAVGVHEFCKGFVDLQEISKTHNAICCRFCHMRIAIPKEVDTFGKLRQWCADEIKRKIYQAKQFLILWGLAPSHEKYKAIRDAEEHEKAEEKDVIIDPGDYLPEPEIPKDLVGEM
jgi:hypothetical protein